MCDIFRRESADLRLTGSVSLALTHRPLLASYTEAAEDRLGERARFGKCAGRARNSGSAVQSLPRRPLRRAPRRRLPPSTGRARRRVLHSRRVEGRAPTVVVVASKLEVEALVGHTNRDSADTIPGIQVTPKGPECTVIRKA